MEDFFAERQFPLIFARHKRIVTEPAFARGSGPVFIHAKRYGQGERVIMPLAADGVHADGLFGATIYEMELRRAPEATRVGYVDTERVDFFALE